MTVVTCAMRPSLRHLRHLGAWNPLTRFHHSKSRSDHTKSHVEQRNSDRTPPCVGHAFAISTPFPPSMSSNQIGCENNAAHAAHTRESPSWLLSQ